MTICEIRLKSEPYLNIAKCWLGHFDPRVCAHRTSAENYSRPCRIDQQVHATWKCEVNYMPGSKHCLSICECAHTPASFVHPDTKRFLWRIQIHDAKRFLWRIQTHDSNGHTFDYRLNSLNNRVDNLFLFPRMTLDVTGETFLVDFLFALGTSLLCKRPLFTIRVFRAVPFLMLV